LQSRCSLERHIIVMTMMMHGTKGSSSDCKDGECQGNDDDGGLCHCGEDILVVVVRFQDDTKTKRKMSPVSCQQSVASPGHWEEVQLQGLSTTRQCRAKSFNFNERQQKEIGERSSQIAPTVLWSS
jgi:hypothetical protein